MGVSTKASTISLGLSRKPTSRSSMNTSTCRVGDKEKRNTVRYNKQKVVS